MTAVLIGSRSHAAYNAIVVDPAIAAAGTFYKPPAIAEGDRVIVLLGYGDVGVAEARLATLELPAGVKLLLVHPDYPEEIGYGRSCAEAARALKATATLRHAPPTELLLRLREAVRAGGAIGLALEGAVPFVAWADVAEAALRWLREGGEGPRALHGPRPLAGRDVAAILSALLAEVLDPKTFARLRMTEMDRNRDGVLAVDELLHFLVSLGTPLEEARRLVTAVDRNQDGTVSLEEFTAGLDHMIKGSLRALPRELRVAQVDVGQMRRYWVSLGLPYRLAVAEAEHLARTESASPVSLSLSSSVSVLRLEEALEEEGEAAPVVYGTLDPMRVLRPHALHLVNLTILPGRGLLTSKESYFGDPEYASLRWSPNDELLASPAQISRLQTAEGPELHTRRARGTEAIEARWTGPSGAAREQIRYSKGSTARVLELEGDRLVGLACRGAWEGLHQAMGDLYWRRPLKAWEKALFREMGGLRVEDLAEPNDPDEVICGCTGVRRGALLEAIDEGRRSLPQIIEITGATTVCGGCTPLVEGLLGSPKLHLAELLSIDRSPLDPRRGGRYVRLRLAPVEVPLAPSKAGQHVVVQGRVQGRWITRAYTLISPAGQIVPYEIAIKREELGLFSRWIADQAHEEALFRVSAPMGEVCLRDEDPGPIYMLAGGIGITPGIALARTLASDPAGRRLHIDWSARQPEDFLFAEELDALAASSDRITWTRRCTSEEPRITAEALRARMPYEAGAVAFLCGPEAFLEAMEAELSAAGWPSGAVRIERFSAKVTDEGVVDEEAAPAPAAPRAVPAGATGAVIQHDSFFLDRSDRWPLLREAELFLVQMYRERGLESVLRARLAEVREEVEKRGTYTHTKDELIYGARLAWRNASRCIGRFFWKHLELRDMRHLETEEQVFEAVVEHLRTATNGGDIRSLLTVFRPEAPTIRLWNSQLIRYAGYRQADGSVVGDPANADMTERVTALGWQGAGTPFDILPIVVQIGDRAPKWFELPREVTMEVPIEHPEHEWFKELGLRWYAVPAVAELALDLGGVRYRCTPFNGFYMGTEIGARNFSDESRYDMLPVIAEKLGLDTSESATLWKDRALVELNIAVLHSYRKAGVRMQDHHTMSKYFFDFEKEEKEAGRPVYGDWSWLVPPMSGSASPLFFRDDLKNVVLKPMYGYQHKPWEEHEPYPDHEGPVPPCPFHRVKK